MNGLVLIPRRKHVEIALVEAGQTSPSWSNRIARSPDPKETVERIAESLKTPGNRDTAIAFVALRGLYGGSAFRRPALVTDAAMSELESLRPLAPLHAPALIALADACRRVFAGIPLVLVFETSFFADLPPRESGYGIHLEGAAAVPRIRYGYHGIYHAAAAAHVSCAFIGKAPRTLPRILSICMEPKPEVAAVHGHTPLMVTGGATPLDGLPGETDSGEIDPGILLLVTEKLNWGPEQINRALIGDSGLVGLTGAAVSLQQALESDDPACQLAAEIVKYRILQACGAGIAAMSGLDAIVFSGNSAGSRPRISDYLTASLIRLPGFPGSGVPVFCFDTPLCCLVAEQACGLLLRRSQPAFAASVSS